MDFINGLVFGTGLVTLAILSILIGFGIADLANHGFRLVVKLIKRKK